MLFSDDIWLISSNRLLNKIEKKSSQGSKVQLFGQLEFNHEVIIISESKTGLKQNITKRLFSVGSWNLVNEKCSKFIKQNKIHRWLDVQEIKTS